MKKMLIEKFAKNLVSQTQLKTVVGGYGFGNGCPNPCNNSGQGCSFVRTCANGPVLSCAGGECMGGF